MHSFAAKYGINTDAAERRAHDRKSGIDQIIELNVGGVVHVTTLSRFVLDTPELRTMVTTPSARDAQGRPFIDRDGELFSHVLSWLREKNTPLPNDVLLLRRLRMEALYYNLPPLVQYVERKLQLNLSQNNPRIVEVKPFVGEADTLGVQEILCIPMASNLESRYPTFNDIPITEGIGRESIRLCTVKHAESVSQVASILHEAAGYRVIGYSNSAVLMERHDDHLR
ncbi:hypothetical protein DIPPA_03597 [Diplonema papillatum]|nr:hypothetical protein DIPPA_03597 [Diplonema papillatum]